MLARIGATCRKPTTVTSDLLADGREVLFDVHEAIVIWDGHPRRVLLSVAPGEPLIGMALLRGHELTIQAVDGGAVRIIALGPT